MGVDMLQKSGLTFPFAFVGAAPFVIVGRPLEAVLAAAAMGLAGIFCRRNVTWRSLGCATTVAGGVAGMFAGSFGAGVLLGLLALFPLRLVAWAGEGGMARRGSLLDNVDVRQAWGVAVILVTVVPLPLFALGVDAPGLGLMMAAGVLVLTAVAIADAYSFVKLGQLARQASEGQDAPLHPVQRDVLVADVGIGDRQHEQRLPGAPYRGADELLSVVRGDAQAARQSLVQRLFLDVGLIALLALLFSVAQKSYGQIP
jgi:hypothetical protein